MDGGGFEQRALLGERLARDLGLPHVRDQLLELRLDPSDTAVTYRTALALLDRRDQLGLELVVLANARADDDAGQSLFDAVVQFRAITLGAEDDLLRAGLEAFAQCPDQSVAAAAQDLLSALR